MRSGHIYQPEVLSCGLTPAGSLPGRRVEAGTVTGPVVWRREGGWVCYRRMRTGSHITGSTGGHALQPAGAVAWVTVVNVLSPSSASHRVTVARGRAGMSLRMHTKGVSAAWEPGTWVVDPQKGTNLRVTQGTQQVPQRGIWGSHVYAGHTHRAVIWTGVGGLRSCVAVGG